MSELKLGVQGLQWTKEWPMF